MKIYITGISGTGKSSIARAVAAQGIRTVDIDDGLCYWRHKQTGEAVEWEPGRSDAWYAEHGWLCNNEAIETLVAENENIVVVGLASNQEAYLPLFDRVYILHCSPETAIARIHARTDNDYGKHPREQERILGWQKTFESEMIAKGALPLDTERPLEEVLADVLSNFS